MPTVTSASLTAPGRAPRARGSLRAGFLALTDAAPLVAAHELGIFNQRGLRVALHREVGWATIRDKILYGDLDAAQALAPMLWAINLGIGAPRTDVLTAFVLSLHGNAITLSRRLAPDGALDTTRLRELARSRTGEARLTFGIVFPFSSHHLQLRQWLRSLGIDPETEVRIVIVPPAQMCRNLAAGTIDGFCSGEPWNTHAVQDGTGFCPTWSAALAPGHVEKVLMVRESFATERAAEHRAFLSALDEAAAWCDEPAHRTELATMLSAPAYLAQPAETILPSLAGTFATGRGTESVPDFHVFHRGRANLPSLSRAAAIQRDLVTAGLVPAGTADAALPAKLFREELYLEATLNHSTLHEANA